MATSKPTVGILGAGKLGITLAQLLTAAGYTVAMSGSGDPEKIRLSASILTPDAIVDTPIEVAKRSDVVILALPLKNFRSLPVRELAGKIVIDAMNYWWEVDGPRDDIIPENLSSSEAVQQFLPDARVVKTFSHMGYHYLFDEHHLTPRKALAIAGNDDEAKRVAAAIVHDAGFDTLDIGALAHGIELEPGHPAFGANLPLEQLKTIINHTAPTAKSA